MARTGKKSIKSKPSKMKIQNTDRRKIRKSSGRDKAMKDKLDKELTSVDLGPTKKSKNEDGLVKSFDALRGL